MILNKNPDLFKYLTCLEPTPTVVDPSAIGHSSLFFEYITENLIIEKGKDDKECYENKKNSYERYENKEDGEEEEDEDDVNNWMLEGCQCGEIDLKDSKNKYSKNINTDYDKSDSNDSKNLDHKHNNEPIMNDNNDKHNIMKKTCNSNQCSCLHYTEGPLYDKNNCLKDTDPFSPRLTFQQECSYLCNCSAECCGNRVVQWGVSRSLRVILIPLKGLGVVTEEIIPAYAFVCEYVGEVFSKICNNDQNVDGCDQVQDDQNTSFKNIDESIEKKNNIKKRKKISGIPSSHNYVLTLSEFYSSNKSKTKRKKLETPSDSEVLTNKSKSTESSTLSLDNDKLEIKNKHDNTYINKLIDRNIEEQVQTSEILQPHNINKEIYIEISKTDKVYKEIGSDNEVYKGSDTEAYKNVYIESMQDMNKHFSQTYKVLKTTIDASKCGNVSRLINHSCQPNTFMSLVRVARVMPRACLFALRDIEVGEELSYDYSGCLQKGEELWEKSESGVERKEVMKRFEMRAEINTIGEVYNNQMNAEQTKVDTNVKNKFHVGMQDFKTTSTKVTIDKTSNYNTSEKTSELSGRKQCLCASKNCKKYLPMGY